MTPSHDPKPSPEQDADRAARDRDWALYVRWLDDHARDLGLQVVRDNSLLRERVFNIWQAAHARASGQPAGEQVAISRDTAAKIAGILGLILHSPQGLQQPDVQQEIRHAKAEIEEETNKLLAGQSRKAAGSPVLRNAKVVPAGEQVQTVQETIDMLEWYGADGRLQSFQDRERFRERAREIIALLSALPRTADRVQPAGEQVESLMHLTKRQAKGLLKLLSPSLLRKATKGTVDIEMLEVQNSLEKIVSVRPDGNAWNLGILGFVPGATSDLNRSPAALRALAAPAQENFEKEIADLIARYYRQKIGELMHQAEHWAKNGKPLAVHDRIHSCDIYFQVVALMESRGTLPFEKIREELARGAPRTTARGRWRSHQ